MKIVTFSPYGSSNPGQATFSLLLRYLHSHCAEITQLHCNGAFSVCERDLVTRIGGGQSQRRAQRGGSRGVYQERTIDHCLQCSSEQREHAQFAGATVTKLTDFLNTDDLQRTREWVLERDADTLWEEEWYGVPLAYMMKETFHRLTGESTPRNGSQRQAAIVKRLALTSIRMAIAAGRCFNRIRPEWIWIPSGQEILSKTTLTVAQENKAVVVRFQTAPDGQMIMVYRDGDSQPYRLQNVVRDIEGVKTEIDSWPRDILGEFDDFMSFMGIPVGQLGLPVAR